MLIFLIAAALRFCYVVLLVLHGASACWQFCSSLFTIFLTNIFLLLSAIHSHLLLLITITTCASTYVCYTISCQANDLRDDVEAPAHTESLTSKRSKKRKRLSSSSQHSEKVEFRRLAYPPRLAVAARLVGGERTSYVTAATSCCRRVCY